MRAVGCAHDMDISGDISISINKDGFKLSIGSDFEGADLFSENSYTDTHAMSQDNKPV